MVSRVPTVERDTVVAAALSGGAQAIVFEKAATAILRKLGFNLSEHLGQKYTKHRVGGYPDIRIRSSVLDVCGLGDTKATVRYTFPLTDTQKLGSYYHDCLNEFPDQTPSQWFLYIAGGFGSNSQTVKDKLKKCAEKYSRPVAAITVNALLDLADMKNPPSKDLLPPLKKMNTLRRHRPSDLLGKFTCCKFGDGHSIFRKGLSIGKYTIGLWMNPVRPHE